MLVVNVIFGVAVVAFLAVVWIVADMDIKASVERDHRKEKP